MNYKTHTPDKMKHSKHATLDFWRRDTHHKLDTFYSLDELEKPFVPTCRYNHQSSTNRKLILDYYYYYYFGGFIVLMVYIYLCQLI